MKKKIFSLILCVVLAFTFVCPVFAAAEDVPFNYMVLDTAELLDAEDAAELNDRAWEITQKYGCAVYIITTPSTEGADVSEYNEYLHSYFGMGYGSDQSCVILLLAMAAPIALANSATFRSKVLQLIMELDEEKGEAYFSLVQDEDASFDVPEGWRGNYFPSYIPDGFTIYDWDPDFGAAFIEYRNGSANQLFFSEYSNGAGVVTGTDNAEMKEIDINGNPAYLIDGIASDGKTHTVNIFWQNETNWFGVVTYGLSTDEALRVARSVRRIVK